MLREKGHSLTESEFLMLKWIADDKEVLEKAGLPTIFVKNMEIYERDTQQIMNLPKKGRKTALRAITKLKSKRLVREDGARNILLTKKGYLIATNSAEGHFNLDKIGEAGIYFMQSFRKYLFPEES